MTSVIQRVKLRVFDPTTGEYIGKSRRTTQCRITTLDNGEVIYKILPNKIVTINDIILEWEHGATPTPKPSKKYSKEQLQGWGYSEELIGTIHRGYNAKTIKSVRNRLDCTREEARELLDRYKYISKIPGCETPKKEIKIKKDIIEEAIQSQGSHKTTFKTVMRKDIVTLKKSNRNQKRKASSHGHNRKRR